MECINETLGHLSNKNNNNLNTIKLILTIWLWCQHNNIIILLYSWAYVKGLWPNTNHTDHYYLLWSTMQPLSWGQQNTLQGWGEATEHTLDGTNKGKTTLSHKVTLFYLISYHAKQIRRHLKYTKLIQLNYVEDKKYLDLSNIIYTIKTRKEKEGHVDKGGMRNGLKIVRWELSQLNRREHLSYWGEQNQYSVWEKNMQTVSRKHKSKQIINQSKQNSCLFDNFLKAENIFA